MSNTRLWTFGLLLGAALVCSGQTITLNFNSLPSAQGWSLNNGCPKPENSLFFVSNNVLYQNTIGCGSSGAAYKLYNVVTGAPFTLTVTARVTADEVFNGGDAGHLGLTFGVEGNDQGYFIGLGPGFIDAYVAGGITVLSTAIDTTQFHTYVLNGTPATGLFTLSVDGVQIASGSAGAEPPSVNDIWVGGASGDANASGEYSAYTFQSGLPPTVSCTATPTSLWPPNGKSVLVTVSGIIAPGTTALASGGVAYAVLDEYDQVQPSGSIALAAGGTYSFGVSLIASRNGNDKNGRTYTIMVGAKDIVGNLGVCSAVVTVPHDQGN